MIHRFVDLLEEAVAPARNIIWNIRRVTGGTTRTFALAGDGLTTPDYLSIPATSSASLDKPHLSPDLSEYVYEHVGAAGTKGQLRIAAADDLSASTLVASNPSGATAETPSGGTQIAGWSADGQQVFYLGQNDNTNNDSEIRVVNRDGTGNTLLWLSTAIKAFAWGILPRVSPDGTKIAFWVDPDSPANEGLWVMNLPSGPTRIYTKTPGGAAGDFYGWSRDSAGFCSKTRASRPARAGNGSSRSGPTAATKRSSMTAKHRHRSSRTSSPRSASTRSGFPTAAASCARKKPVPGSTPTSRSVCCWPTTPKRSCRSRPKG